MSKQQASPKSRLVLLVEDEESYAGLVDQAIAEVGLALELEVVTDGEQALRFLQRKAPYQAARRPHVILLDLNLPGADGFEVLDTVKSDSDLRDIPVIVLSSSRNDKDVNRAYQLQANSYMTKPAEFDQMVKLINDLGQYWLGSVRLPTTR